jgi:hypothetical protein
MRSYSRYTANVPPSNQVTFDRKNNIVLSQNRTGEPLKPEKMKLYRDMKVEGSCPELAHEAVVPQ